MSFTNVRDASLIHEVAHLKSKGLWMSSPTLFYTPVLTEYSVISQTIDQPKPIYTEPNAARKLLTEGN